jgi:hypothetical protein
MMRAECERGAQSVMSGSQSVMSGSQSVMK